VKRNCQVNLGFVIGNYDFGYTSYVSRDTTMESFHTNKELTPENWYIIDDLNETCTDLGNIFATDVTKDSRLKDAVYNRMTRIVSFNAETHARNVFSVSTATDVVKYFEQTLGYNRGDLGAGSTVPLDARSIVYLWRELFNGIAMLAMIAMLFPVAGLLLKQRFFTPCVVESGMTGQPGIGRKKFLIFGAISVVLGFIAIYTANSLFAPALPYSGLIPIWTAWWLTFVYLGIVTTGAIVLLVIFIIIDKKNEKTSGLKILNVKMKPAVVLKTVLLSLILLVLAYLSLALIEYLFDEDYRLWAAVFTDMKVEYWSIVLVYAILMLPFLLVIGSLMNYSVRRDVSEWKNTLFIVIISSLGVWLCCFINYIIHHAGGQTFSNWNSSYAMLLFVPVTSFITLKMYKITNSVWLGSLINSLLFSWTLVSSLGYHTWVPQSFFSVFFNV
jgi:hypothetical protein